ncbi:hypothetical protein AVEN_264613-1, partial [Araneus ventricosus]
MKSCEPNSLSTSSISGRSPECLRDRIFDVN